MVIAWREPLFSCRAERRRGGWARRLRSVLSRHLFTKFETGLAENRAAHPRAPPRDAESRNARPTDREDATKNKPMSLVRTTSFAAHLPLARLIGGLGAGQIVGWGTSFYLPTILASDISRDTGLSEEIVYAGVTVMLLVSASLAPWLGRRLDRGGARVIMTSGSVLAALALTLIGLSFDLKSYLFAWVVMGVASSMLLTNSAFVAVAQLAGASARRAMTVLMLFTGVASSVAWPSLSFLDGALGWRMTCFLLAALHLFISAPFHSWLLRTRIAPSPGALPARPVQEGYLPRSTRSRS